MSNNKSQRSKTISLDYLARVEGEGSLYLQIEDGTVKDAKLKIFEPPRFFEGFLRGRSFLETPDITARICGICPVAYQMSSVHAMESICGVELHPTLRELRRLLYCGEWIESHALHIFMLHAPDFLGYTDAIAMAKDHKDIVEKGLKLKKVGNEILRMLGGREIHPINVKIGGFYKVPDKKYFTDLLPQLHEAQKIAEETALWLSGLEFPDFQYDYEFVAMRHPEEYPMNAGRICSNKGLDIGVNDYEEHFVEEHIQHSTALHSVLKSGAIYHTGPLARYALNFQQLTDNAKFFAQKSGLNEKCTNPFKSIIVRAIEIIYACEEAIRIIEHYRKPELNSHNVQPKAGTGKACTEAPRGILYHRYTIDDKGRIQDAKIVPPTSQNQKMIEDDLKRLVKQYIDLDDKALTHKCEQAIRNYDPCISCSTHFLNLTVDR